MSIIWFLILVAAMALGLHPTWWAWALLIPAVIIDIMIVWNSDGATDQA